MRLGPQFGPAHAHVRAGLAERLARARESLPQDMGLQVVEGHRPLAQQQAIIAAYTAEVVLAHPGCSKDERHRLVSRYVSPVQVAPHVAGAAVDVTLVTLAADGSRAELDLGTPVDATPEESGGRCFTDSTGFDEQARRRRDLLCRVLVGAGLVNYPTEWWHWSYGDRYWALLTGAPEALYGPVGSPPGASRSRTVTGAVR